MSDSTQPPLVLVTGITGFLSAHVLDSLLASPEKYRIRGTLRSKASKGEALLARLTPEQRKRVELVEVKATESSDLSEALKGVDYVLHVASPYQLNVEDVQRDLLTPAKEGTLNVLRYAAKETSVKFVGITSSFAAVTDLNKGGPNRPSFTYTESDWNPAGEKEALDFGGQGAFAYSASKKIAEKAAFDFVEREKPGFGVASFNPPMIYGPTLQPGVTRRNLNTSSATIYNLISNASEMPADRLPLFCHARDVADAHVRSLAKATRGASGRRFLLCGGKFNWAMAVHFIAETRPELRSRLPKGWEDAKPEATPTSNYASLDTSASEEVLGMQFRDWQTTLGETVDSLLELERGEGWEK